MAYNTVRMNEGLIDLVNVDDVKYQTAPRVQWIWIEEHQRHVRTENRWFIGFSEEHGWCATNRSTNGYFFANKSAMESFRRYLSRHGWDVAAL